MIEKPRIAPWATVSALALAGCATPTGPAPRCATHDAPCIETTSTRDSET